MKRGARRRCTTRVLVAVPIVVVIVIDVMYVWIAYPFITAYLAVMAALLMASLTFRGNAPARTAVRAAAAVAGADSLPGLTNTIAPMES